MASPPLLPTFRYLASRPFAFYPPIHAVPHNEWIFRKATWSELVVVNAKTGEEASVPRHFIGEVSPSDDPMAIVGLIRELEYRDGAVGPCQRRVIEMPVAVGADSGPVAVPRRAAPAPIVAIRLESRSDSRIFRMVGGALAVTIVLHLAVINLMRVSDVRQRSAYNARPRSLPEFSGTDRYDSIVRALGPPTWERWHQESGAMLYHALGYPDRRFIVILMGSDRDSAAYIGTLDPKWQLLHSVPLASGGSTTPLLRHLDSF